MRTAIDFYLYATHEVATWKPIIESLRDFGADARYVLEPPGRNLARGSSPDPHKSWQDHKTRRLVPLVDEVQYQQLYDQVTAAGHTPLDRLRPGADGAVTSSGSRWLRCWHGARIRCMYGVGLVTDAYGHGVVNEDFDLVLAHGCFSRQEIARNAPGVPVAMVGFPKWAAYRRGQVRGQPESSSIQDEGSTSDRPVVLWLPTWADHSSLDAYRSAISTLTQTADVIMKPHHNTARFEDARLRWISDTPGIQLMPVTSDLPALMSSSDVVVSDVRSGGVTEALLADRPVVALADESLTPDVLHPRGLDALTVCSAPADLSEAVSMCLADTNKEARRELVVDLFGPGGGDDDARASEAILETVRRVKHPGARRATSPLFRTAYRVARRIGR